MIEFPRKRISVGGLLCNEQGEILIVKPVYREGWLLPGGVVDADESPAAGLKREIQEELGLVISPMRLRCVDYLSTGEHYGEGINFLFDCGVIAQTPLNAIVLCQRELSAFKFVDLLSAHQWLVPSIAKRLQHLQMHEVIYLENGSPPLFINA